MNDEELKNIKAPVKGGPVTPNQKKINTIIFTVVTSILNLAFTILFCLLLLVLISVIMTKGFGYSFEQFSQSMAYLKWLAVAFGIGIGYLFNFLFCKFLIIVFKLKDKIDSGIAEKYLNHWF